MGLTKSTVTLAWHPPRRDGGLPITNYIVESKSSASYDWTTCTVGRYVTEPTCQVSISLERKMWKFIRHLQPNKLEAYVERQVNSVYNVCITGAELG